MFSSFSRPGLSELPARVDFKAVDLVDPQAEPVRHQWRNPEQTEYKIQFGPPTREQLVSWPKQADKAVEQVNAMLDRWNAEPFKVPPQYEQALRYNVAAAMMPLYPQPKIGDTFTARRPQRSLDTSERIRQLQKMQREWPAAAAQIQHQIDALR